MDAQELINKCERQARDYSTDQVARLSYHVGLLRAELRNVCEQMQPAAGLLDHHINVMFGDTPAVATFTLDSSDDICMTGVWINGRDVMLALTDDQLNGIEDQIQMQGAAIRKQSAQMRADSADMGVLA